MQLIRKNLYALILIILVIVNAEAISKIQQQGIKTHADCSAAGVSDANCLPLTSQIYDSFNGGTLAASIAGNLIGSQAVTGTIVMYGGTSAPTAWLMSDGTSYLRTAQSALFTVIGCAYGCADSTHFNVPDMRGNIPRGTASVLATGGNLFVGTPCITPGVTTGLAVGMYVYDVTNPSFIPTGSTIVGIPGGCTAGQVQILGNATSNATGDTLNFAIRDPGAFTRTALYTGGNTGFNVGTYEADALASHTHTYTGFSVTASVTGNAYTNSSINNYFNNPTLTSNPTGDLETRPKNVYVNFIIKN